MSKTTQYKSTSGLILRRFSLGRHCLCYTLWAESQDHSGSGKRLPVWLHRPVGGSVCFSDIGPKAVTVGRRARGMRWLALQSSFKVGTLAILDAQWQIHASEVFFPTVGKLLIFCFHGVKMLYSHPLDYLLCHGPDQAWLLENSVSSITSKMIPMLSQLNFSVLSPRPLFT